MTDKNRKRGASSGISPPPLFCTLHIAVFEIWQLFIGERRLKGRHNLRLRVAGHHHPRPQISDRHYRSRSLGDSGIRHLSPSGSRTQASQTPPSSFFPPYRQTRPFLGRLFHSLAVPGPGSSRRWIWNRGRRSAPTESQHSFPSIIGRQVPWSNIYPTVPPPSAQGNRC